LTPTPMAGAALTSLATLGREASRLLAAGPRAWSAAAIGASRITRQTLRGKEGGVYFVLAPGPSLLLAPTLRLDRALNLRRGTPGYLIVSVLAWNALGAALVAALFLFLRDATARPGLSGAVAASF